MTLLIVFIIISLLLLIDYISFIITIFAIFFADAMPPCFRAFHYALLRHFSFDYAALLRFIIDITLSLFSIIFIIDIFDIIFIIIAPFRVPHYDMPRC